MSALFMWIFTWEYEPERLLNQNKDQHQSIVSAHIIDITGDVTKMEGAL